MAFRRIRRSSLPQAVQALIHSDTLALTIMMMHPENPWTTTEVRLDYTADYGTQPHSTERVVNLITGQMYEGDKDIRREREVRELIGDDSLDDVAVLVVHAAKYKVPRRYEIKMNRAAVNKYLIKDPIELPPQVASLLHVYANVRSGAYRKKALQEFEHLYGAGSETVWNDWMLGQGLLKMNAARAKQLTPRGEEFASRVPDAYDPGRSLYSSKSEQMLPLKLDGMYIGTFAGLLNH